MCNANVVNRVSCFCLIIFFLEVIGGGFGHPLAMALQYCQYPIPVSSELNIRSADMMCIPSPK